MDQTPFDKKNAEPVRPVVMSEPPALASAIATLRRPRLLFQAARLGLSDYRRERDLRRLLGPGYLAAEVLERLLFVEQRHEEIRLSRAVTYSAADHVDVLIALICEAQLAQRRL